MLEAHRFEAFPDPCISSLVAATQRTEMTEEPASCWMNTDTMKRMKRGAEISKLLTESCHSFMAARLRDMSSVVARVSTPPLPELIQHEQGSRNIIAASRTM